MCVCAVILTTIGAFPPFVSCIARELLQRRARRLPKRTRAHRRRSPLPWSRRKTPTQSSTSATTLFYHSRPSTSRRPRRRSRSRLRTFRRALLNTHVRSRRLMPLWPWALMRCARSWSFSTKNSTRSSKGSRATCKRCARRSHTHFRTLSLIHALLFIARTQSLALPHSHSLTLSLTLWSTRFAVGGRREGRG